MYVSGQDTPDDADSTPELISAVDAITFMVEPGDTLAVSAKSLKPALLAMARILPVDGWMATIELLACAATAERAADSARASIVVARLSMLFGAMMAAWLFGIAVPLAFWISTYRPGLPFPGGACFSSRLAIVVSPGSLYAGDVGAVAVAHLGDLGRDPDRGQVGGRGEVRRQDVGVPGDVPQVGVLLLVGDQLGVVAPVAGQGLGAVGVGHLDVHREGDRLARPAAGRGGDALRRAAQLPQVQVLAVAGERALGRDVVIGEPGGGVEFARLPRLEERGRDLLRVLARRGSGRDEAGGVRGALGQDHEDDGRGDRGHDREDPGDDGRHGAYATRAAWPAGHAGAAGRSARSVGRTPQVPRPARSRRPGTGRSVDPMRTKALTICCHPSRRSPMRRYLAGRARTNIPAGGQPPAPWSRPGRVRSDPSERTAGTWPARSGGS